MHTTLLKNVEVVRGKNAVAAGTSNQTSTTIDMEGFEGIFAIAAFGTLTAGQVTKLKAQQGSVSDGSDAADITSGESAGMADADSNKLILLDVYRPQKRYLTFVIERATQNAVIDGLVFVKYGPRKAPVSQSTTVSTSLALTPTA